MKCDRCNKPATIHLTEIRNGKSLELHLCQQCAAEAGYLQQTHLSMNDMLTEFVKAKTGMSKRDELVCPDCGMKWQEFKDTGLLGCPEDYEIFSDQLRGVIENAQRGATHHTGKTPTATMTLEDSVKLRQAELSRLKKDLTDALEHESYEVAAMLRDQIKALEAVPPTH